jgi:diketogulonate reductase-like aldo/keto reductase
VAQCLLRWAVQHGYGVIPKSAHGERIRTNFALEDFELAAEDMQALDELYTEHTEMQTCWDPRPIA